jgi:hypothetical protein
MEKYGQTFDFSLDRYLHGRKDLIRCIHSDNPAGFAYPELVLVQHPDWPEFSDESSIYPQVYPVLMAVRDEIATHAGTFIQCHDDAIVGISSPGSWFDWIRKVEGPAPTGNMPAACTDAS